MVLSYRVTGIGNGNDHPWHRGNIMNQAKQNSATARPDDRQSNMNVVIGYVLLGGVLLSAALIVAGFLWHWLKAGDLNMDYTISRMNLFEFVTASVREAAQDNLRPRLLLSLGIAALLLTPYIRVFVSLLYFALVEHNWKYSAFTGFVLLVLTYSLFLR